MNCTIIIPSRADHEGVYSMTISVPWVCLHCGGPRGMPEDVLSYDGSLRMQVSGWTNPCGHIEKYSEVREAYLASQRTDETSADRTMMMAIADAFGALAEAGYPSDGKKTLADLIRSALAEAIADMERRKDAAYEERNRVVAALASAFPSGIARTAIEGWSEDWHGCVYIDLPTGQASWHYHDSQAHLFAHLPAYAKTWDGHSTEEKYRLLEALRPEPAMIEPDPNCRHCHGTGIETRIDGNVDCVCRFRHMKAEPTAPAPFDIVEEAIRLSEMHAADVVMGKGNGVGAKEALRAHLQKHLIAALREKGGEA